MDGRSFVSGCVVSAGLVLGALHAVPARAQALPGEEWVSVAKGDRTEMFVKPSTLKWDGPWLSVRTLQNFIDPQLSAKKNKTFLSARNEYRIDCTQRRLAYRELRAFAGLDLQGAVVQKTKVGEKNLKWMDAPERTVFGELLDYACSNAPQGAPGVAQ